MHESMLLQAYREHEWELRRFLARRLGSAHLASDIAHDLYLKLLGGGADHPEIRDRKAYLFSMAANLATDHLRVERRRGEILEQSADQVWRQSDELTPERHAMARAELRFLEAAVATLPERCRQVFHLNRYEGKSQAEIAALLGLGLTSVYRDLKLVMTTLLDARRRFRAGIERGGQGN
jgi:RNA polymerase sigma-70 factor (ECF subfamily)